MTLTTEHFSRQGRNPIDVQSYVQVHGDQPSGRRRWRFLCLRTDDRSMVLSFHVDCDFATTITAIQHWVQEQVGDCTIQVHATSGPPLPTMTGPEILPHDWDEAAVIYGWVYDH